MVRPGTTGVLRQTHGRHHPHRRKEIKKAFTTITRIKKIRIASSVQQKVTSADKDTDLHDGTMNTALGLLAKGDMNCAGAVVKPTADLFDTKPPTTNPTTDIPKPQTDKTDKPGRVESPEEKHNRERRHQDEHVVPTQPIQTRKGGCLSRGYKSWVELGKNIIAEENENTVNR